MNNETNPVAAAATFKIRMGYSRTFDGKRCGMGLTLEGVRSMAHAREVLQARKGQEPGFRYEESTTYQIRLCTDVLIPHDG